MTTSNSQDPVDRGGVARLWTWAIRVIGAFATLLGLLFAWVQLREIPLPPIENAEPTYIRRLALAFYYACWVAGTTVDANVQKEVYRRDPKSGKVSREVFLAVMGLFVVVAVLLWASSSDERVSLALAPFLVVNVMGWRVVVRRVTPIIESTYSLLRRDQEYVAIEQLNLIASYINGRWQWFRFAIMAVIVAAADIVTFSPAARSLAVDHIHAFMPTTTRAAVANLLPVACLVLFILIAEGWIWLLRLRNAIALQTIDAIAEKYTLKPGPDGG
jgi:hypothetical protein